MSRITKRAFIVLCAGVLVACGSAPPKLSTARPEGFIATTLTTDGGRAWYAILVDNIDTKQKYRFGIAADGQDEDLKVEGRPLVANLPIGRYEISGYGMETTIVRAYHKMSTPLVFNVEAGKTTYLGNVHFANIAWNWRYRPEVTLSDEATRDLPILKKRFEGLATAPVSVAVKPGTRRLLVVDENPAEYPLPMLFVRTAAP